MRSLPLLLLFACTSQHGGSSLDSASGDGAASDGGLADGGATDGGLTDGGGIDTGTQAKLHGSVPAKALAAPEFAALNRDGAPRSREDLLGHPTVIWFYPLAASSG